MSFLNGTLFWGLLLKFQISDYFRVENIYLNFNNNNNNNSKAKKLFKNYLISVLSCKILFYIFLLLVSSLKEVLDRTVDMATPVNNSEAADSFTVQLEQNFVFKAVELIFNWIVLS